MFLSLAHTRKPVFLCSKELVLECYRVTNLFLKEEKYAMISQIRRAALSVHLNIAEGCSRRSIAERRRFFEIARGSLIETDTALGIACHLSYCSEKELASAGQVIINCFKQLSGLIG